MLQCNAHLAMHKGVFWRLVMTEVTLRAVHPAETKEIASLSARFLTQTVIAMAAILTFVPFVVYFIQH
jgi:hypothetical protein